MLKYEFYSASEDTKERPFGLHCFKYSKTANQKVNWLVNKAPFLALYAVGCSKSGIDIRQHFVDMRQYNATQCNIKQQNGKKSKICGLISQCEKIASSSLVGGFHA